MIAASDSIPAGFGEGQPMKYDGATRLAGVSDGLREFDVCQVASVVGHVGHFGQRITVSDWPLDSAACFVVNSHHSAAD